MEHRNPFGRDHAVDVLARTRLFGGLDQEALQRVADSVVERRFRRGAVVFSQGDEGTSLYVVASGRLKLAVTTASGSTIVLTTLTHPDTFGELALVDGRPRSATVAALEPSVLLTVGRPTVLSLLSDQPAVSDALLRGIGATVRRLTQQAADLALLDLTARVAKLLVTLADQPGVPGTTGADAVVELHLTQADMAQMVGGTRQSVNQILSGFASRGLIEVRGRTILLRRLTEMRRRAGL
jgi:CRP/FNR family transcriptional regulator, cyclic AMP receptor protein